MKESFALSLLFICAICRAQLSQDTIDAMTWGAETKVTFQVVDYDGKPVTNAQFGVAWSCDYTNRHKDRVIRTDKNGHVVLDEKSRGAFTYSIEKEGYYKSSGKYSLDVSGESHVKDGRWEPWNQTVKIVLKEKRNPAPMISCEYLADVPLSGVSLGYDLAEGDWMPPYGSGKTADLKMTYDRLVTTNFIRRYTSRLTIVFPNPYDGCYIVKKDTFSTFDKPYEAASPKEQRVEFILDGTDEKVIADDRLDTDEVLVFRVRTEIDNQGKVVRCHYGYIDGPFKFAQGPAKTLRLQSVFNPRNLDRNLEWDGNNATVKK